MWDILFMSRKEKLLKKAKGNPYGLAFSEFENLLKHSGWKRKKNNGGSHLAWESPDKKHKLMIQNLKGKAKGYQVKQFLEIFEQKETEDALETQDNCIS